MFVLQVVGSDVYRLNTQTGQTSKLSIDGYRWDEVREAASNTVVYLDGALLHTDDIVLPAVSIDC